MSKEIVTSFYDAFKKLDADTMEKYYHELAYFSDPVFRDLTAEETMTMWRMLFERSKGNLDVHYHSVEELEDDKVTLIWEAKYAYGKGRRPVHNIIRATMTLEDDLIILHEDSFDFWKWTRMALGSVGTVLGWSPYLRGVVRNQARSALMSYIIDNLETTPSSDSSSEET